MEARGSGLEGELRTVVGPDAGQFEPLRLLHRGWESHAWLARERSTGQQVVLKVFALASEHLGERFLHEQDLLRAAPHPHLAPALAALPHPRGLLTVTPFVPGVTLASRLARGPLPLREALDLARAVLSALVAAHAQGVLHRDLKPSNVVLRGNAPGGAVVVDFGLAFSERHELGALAPPLHLVRYLAPEQAGLLREPVGAPADLYALGALLFEALTGRQLFGGGSLALVLRQQLHQPVPSLRAQGLPVPGALEAILERLLHKAPGARYQSARAVLADLEVLGGALEAGAAGPLAADEALAPVVGHADVRRRPTRPAFVGRDAELARLEAVLAPTADGHGRLVLVQGPAGVGKSRLLAELAAHAGLRGFRLLSAPAGGSPQAPLAPFEGLAASLLDQARTDPAVGLCIRARLGQEGAAVGGVLPSLVELLHHPPGPLAAPRAPRADPTARRALGRLLDALGAPTRPALVLMDTQGELDSSTQRALAEWAYARRAGARHTSVVVAVRSEAAAATQTLAASADLCAVALAPLPAQVLLQLCRSAAGPLPASVLARAAHQAGGVPARALELLEASAAPPPGPGEERGEGAPEDLPGDSGAGGSVSLAERFPQLLDAGPRIVSALSARGVLSALHEAALRTLPVTRCAVLTSGALEPAAALEPGLAREPALDVLRTGQPQHGAGALYIPVLQRGRAAACLALLSPSQPGGLSGSDRRLAEFLAAMAGAALESAESYARMEALLAEQVRLHAQAREALVARDDFLQVAAHELRTPLTALQLQVQSAAARVHAEPELVKRKLGVASARARRLAQLIDELLDVTQLSESAPTLARERLDLAALVRRGCQRLQERAERAGCRLELEAPAPVLGCWDRQRLEQVVHHLLDNALKYGAGRPVRVRVEAREREAQLEIEDEGPGVSPEDQQRIFRRFERAVSVHHYGGLGLGLWRTNQLVRGHGGQVRVRSQLGEGATFQVTLPLEPPGSPG